MWQLIQSDMDESLSEAERNGGLVICGDEAMCRRKLRDLLKVRGLTLGESVIERNCAGEHYNYGRREGCPVLTLRPEGDETAVWDESAKAWTEAR